MATETDAARDRVLAARAALGGELETLEASARAALDVPARVRRSPVKAAAVAGGAAFLVFRGPKRVWRAGKRAVFGPPAPFPASMLPDEIEQTLRALGDDGDKVRGALERDFAAYAKQAKRDRAGLRTYLTVGIAQPLLKVLANAAIRALFRPDDAGFMERLGQVRERTARRADEHDASSDLEAEETSGA